MLVDRVVITVRSGKGGDGHVSFRREKYINKGGPTGGDGGKGGDVYLLTDPNVESLIDLTSKHYWEAAPGDDGGKKQCIGASAIDLELRIPPGTLVYDDTTGELLQDMDQPGLKLLVAKGGKGGFGNEHFKNSINQTPREWTPGEPSEEKTQGNALKNGIPTVIVGKPNAGKSTLLNRLLNENRAIVSHVPGTTRDVIEDRLYIDGFEFRIMDTAGIRATEDVIEAEGVKRTLEKIETASIVCLLYDASRETLAETRAYLHTLRLPAHVKVLLLANKQDLSAPTPLDDPSVLAISALAGSNIDTLKSRLAAIAREMSSEDIVTTNQRHVQAFQKLHASLEHVLLGLTNRLSGELLAVDIRQALHYLGEITGIVTNDEILGTIFSKFCIGK